jgi:hypothetical protein
MSLLTPRRLRKVAVAAAAATLAAGVAVVALPQTALAVVNYGVTITSTSPLRVPAGLANRVVVITGTNFDEDQIVSIELGTDADCMALTSYVVTSSTSISVKTPGVGTAASAPGCAASASQTIGEDITINQTESGEVVKTGSTTAGVIFVPPPTILAVGSSPVITENSSAMLLANQVDEFTPAGNQLIRVKATADFAFSGATGATLSGTFGGKALTTVGFFAADGTTAQGLTTAPASGGLNFWVARTGTALTTTGTGLNLTITQNGVTRSFTPAETGATFPNVPTITSLDVNSGKAGGGTVVKITGTGFSTTPGDFTVQFCDIDVVPTAATAVLLTVTAPNTSHLALGLGSGVYGGVCPVTVTRVTGGLISPISSASNFTYLLN